jgi:predicted MFS family arabinose efflux permease
MARLSRIRHQGGAECLRRVLAAVCAGLVFALGLFAASPNLHDQLHHNAHLPDDGCAVVLFAGGVSVPLTATPLPAPSTEWREESFVSSTELILAAPRYLLPPTHGPPVA